MGDNAILALVCTPSKRAKKHLSMFQFCKRTAAVLAVLLTYNVTPTSAVLSWPFKRSSSKRRTSSTSKKFKAVALVDVRLQSKAYHELLKYAEHLETQIYDNVWSTRN